MKTKRRMKRNKPLIAAACGVLTVVLVTVGVFAYRYLTRVGYKSTGLHQIANRLNDTVELLPYLKDGNMYCYKNGRSLLWAENVYDPDSADPVYTADYAIDTQSKQLLFTSGQTLYLFDGAEIKTIGAGVTSWRTSKGFNAIAFTTKWQNSDSLGALFLYKDGQVISLDTGITPTTVRFSQDGTCLFAEKPNLYPQIRSKLFRYELDGTKTLKHESSYPILWTNSDGSRVITGENNDDSLYSYRIFSKNFKNKLDLGRVYYSEVSSDQSILYLLHDYDQEAYSGTLTAVDLYTLRTKKLAQNVSFFNTNGVTDASKGVLYSVLSDAEKGFYTIYYTDISGKSTRLVRNTREETLYSIAVNSQNKTGYILSPGATRNDGGLYRIEWKGSSLDTARLASGYLDSLVYYEATDTVTYIKDPANGEAGLYWAEASGSITLLSERCGVTYNSGDQTYTSAAVLSNDTKSLLYFTDIVTGNTTVDTKGSLWLNKNGTAHLLDENVSSAYMEAPVTDGKMDNVFYLKETDTGLDMYLFNGTESVLIDTNVHGMIEINGG